VDGPYNGVVFVLSTCRVENCYFALQVFVGMLGLLEEKLVVAFLDSMLIDQESFPDILSVNDFSIWMEQLLYSDTIAGDCRHWPGKVS